MPDNDKQDKTTALLTSTPDEKLRLDALVLAAGFLQIVQATMDKRNMTRKSLADAMGTSPSWLTQLFRGDKLPSFVTLARMADILDIDFQISASKMTEENPAASASPEKQEVRNRTGFPPLAAKALR